ncbi:uncharacterized protein [Anabrus simplex]|uniref:uncharacterized protein isoform X3 n=1 Tax=Anabrus simplex TaxID=316456 RepID=UPI0035A3C27A
MAQVGYRYSVSQRVFIYDSYVRTKSARTVRRLFQEKFPDVQVPGRTSIHRLVNKLRTTGSLLDKKRNKPRTVLTQETVSNIGNALERSPTKSLRRLAQEMEISYGSVRTGTKLLKSNGQFPKQVPEVLGQRREAVSTSGVIYVSKKTSNDRASTAKKVKRSNRSKNREMLVPGRNSNSDVTITPTTAPDRTSFAGVFVKEEPQSAESEMDIPVTEELNMIEVKGEPVEGTVKLEVVETMVAADSC